jgi:PAS domain S-box-containing protein
MNWITVFWSMTVGICLGFAAFNAIVWLRSVNSWANLTFALCAACVSVIGVLELLLIQADTTVAYGHILRWMHVPVAIGAISLVWFIRFYLGRGRLWLAWSICGLRALALIVNFSSSPNINFREITALRQVRLWGEFASVPEGFMNPWVAIIRISELLLLVYAMDAAILHWRRDRQRRGLVVAIGFFIAIVTMIVLSIMMVTGTLPIPMTISIPFMSIVFVIGSELSGDLVRSRQLAVDLQRSWSLINLVTNAADITLWEYDPVRNKCWSTESGASCGFVESECMNAECLVQSVHPDDSKVTQQAVLRAINGEEKLQVKYRKINPDGAVRWIEICGWVQRRADGKALCMRGTSIDITEREKASQMLRDSETRFRVTFEQAAVGIAHVGLDGRFIRVNQKFGEITGYSRDELRARTFKDITYPEDLDQNIQYVSQLLNGSIDTFAWEKRYLRKDREVVWGSLTCSIVRKKTGEPDWFIAVIQDISVRRKMQEALCDSQERLQLLAGRLLTAHEDERRRLARELHDDLSQRLALIALEAGNLERMNPQPESPMQTQLQAMRQAIIELSKDMHSLSRQIHPAILDDLGLVHALRSECAGFSRREGIQVAYEVTDVPAAIPKNVAICFYRIAQEGLRNIAKHSRAEKASVIVSWLDGKLILTVRDNGIGYDMINASKGRGIGHVIIAERIRLIGGEFFVMSKPGEGTVIKAIVFCD